MSYVRPSIAAMQGYVSGEQPHGQKVIKLNTNENPYPCSPHVITAIQRAAEKGLERYPDAHATSFRLRASELFNLDPEMILCGNGSDDILTILTRTFLDAGDRLRSASPSYILYKTLAEIQGAKFELIPFQSDWSLGKDFTAPADRLKLVYLANPNSPSGTVLSPARIAEIAEQLPCPLLVDEAYADFSETNCMDLVKTNPKILVARTLSKSYALAGLRFGFVVGSSKLINEMHKVRDSYNCDSLSIAGATAALDDQAWLAETTKKIIATRHTMTEKLRALGYAPVPSSANFVWCPNTGTPLKPVYEYLKKNGILIRYMNYNVSNNPKDPTTHTAPTENQPASEGLRISVGTESQIEAFFTVLSSYQP